MFYCYYSSTGHECKSLHLQPHLGTGFNTESSWGPGEGLASFFTLHLPLLADKETSRGNGHRALPTQLLLTSEHTPDVGTHKTSRCKAALLGRSFQTSDGVTTPITRVSVLHPKKTILTAGKQLSPLNLKCFCCQSGYEGPPTPPSLSKLLLGLSQP